MLAERKKLIQRLRTIGEADFSLPVSLGNGGTGDGAVGQHRHWQREIAIVIAGAPVYAVRGELFASRPGTVFLFDRWMPHDFMPTPGNAGGLLAVLHFHDVIWWCLVGYAREEDRWGSIAWSMTAADKNLAAFVDGRVQCWCAEGERPSQNTFDDLVRKPLFLLFDVYVRRLIDSKTEPDLESGCVIDLVKSRIENNVGKKCSLEELARFSGYSKSRLSHLFREQTGRTIGQYIDHIRQRVLLAGHIGGLKQKEIAFNLGFKTPSTFSTWLKKNQRRTDAPAMPPGKPQMNADQR